MSCRCAHPHVKLSSLITGLYLEDVEDAGVTRGGLHLEDVCRHTAPRRQVHVSVQDGEGLVPAGRVLSCAHALTAEDHIHTHEHKNQAVLLDKK